MMNSGFVGSSSASFPISGVLSPRDWFLVLSSSIVYHLLTPVAPGGVCLSCLVSNVT